MYKYDIKIDFKVTSGKLLQTEEFMNMADLGPLKLRSEQSLEFQVTYKEERTPAYLYDFAQKVATKMIDEKFEFRGDMYPVELLRITI